MGNGSQFDGIGFAPGVVRGARAFDIDELGRLVGVTHRQVWIPGENIAECRKGKGADGLWSGYLNLTFTYRSSVIAASTPAAKAPKTFKGRKAVKAEPVMEEVEPEEPPHTMADCACGFYGYYDGSNDYRQKGRVNGIVEGYGEALIGTRGFRVAKARIVALAIPRSVSERKAALVRRNYGALPIFTSFKQMVSEFPPDGGEVGISPETDPEFWTRAI